MLKTSIKKLYKFLIAALTIVAVIGCSVDGNNSDTDTSSYPTITSISPADTNINVPINSKVAVVFSEEMDSSTIISTNFKVNDGTDVPGTVAYMANNTAVFTPTALLRTETEYTITVSTGVTDISGDAMATDKVWSFTTDAPGIGPSLVNLGTSGNFAILAKTGVSTVPDSVITGDVGLSPAAETFLTGFSQTDATGYATSPQVTGFLYAADMTSPTPTMMTTAIADMELAYSEASGRITPDFGDIGTGTLNAMTLAPGLYNWGTGVGITGDITIDGAANDVWIFQVNGDLVIDANKNISLAGGALSRNIFWQVTGETIIKAGAHFEGIVLSKTAITMVTSATMNGRLLAQTNIALDQSTVTEPSL